MRIARIELRDFGCLSGHIAFQPEGLNLWIAPNEEGKSTVAAAILEALYGPPSPRKTKKEHAQLRRLRPLNDGAFCVHLDIEVQGRRIRIERNFKQGQVRIKENGRDVTEEFRARKSTFEIGEKLLDLTREEFQKSVFVAQGEMEAIRQAGDVTRVLQRIADAQGGDRTVAEALLLLERIESNYPLQSTGKGRLKLSTEKKRLQSRVDELANDIKIVDEKRRSIRDKETELTQLHQTLSNKRKEKAHALVLCHKAELIETENKLEQNVEKQERIRRLEEEQEDLSDYASFPKERQRNLHRWLDEIERLSAEIPELETQLEGICQKMESCQERLQELGALSECTRRERDELLGLIEKLEEAEQSTYEVEQELNRERERLEEEGFHRERLEELQRSFQKLSPENRRVLRNILQTRANRAQRREQAHFQKRQQKEILQKIEDQRTKVQGIAKKVWFSGLATMVIGAAVAWISLSIVGILAGALIVIFGMVLQKWSMLRGSTEYAQARLELRQAEQMLDELEQGEQEEQSQLELLSRGLNIQSEEEVLTQFEEWQALQHEMEELQRLLSKQDDAQSIRSRLLEEAHRWCKSREIKVPQDAASPLLREILSQLDRAIEIRSRLEQLEDKKSELEAEIARRSKELQQQEEAVEQLLQESGLDSSLRGKQAREASGKAVEKAERFQQLKREIEREREQLISPEERRRLEDRKRELEEFIAHAESEWSEEWINYKPDGDSIFYQRQLENLDREIEELQKKISCLEDDLRDIQKETRKLPELQRELQDVQRSLRRAEQVEMAISIARETLEHISTEVHEIWAEHLNEFAVKAFQEILPHYGEPHFEKDLRLTFVHSETGQRVDASEDNSPPRLSGGTLEQLYFIIRAAVADFLSRGESKPPLILDEPFPHSHDERFLKGMKFLAERLAQDRQVIVFSCHKIRHQWLIEQAPELQEHIHLVEFHKQ